MDDNSCVNDKGLKRKNPDNVDFHESDNLAPVQKLTAFSLRSSTRLLNKQKTKSDDVPSASSAGSDCKCGESSCELCARLSDGHAKLFIGKKRDFWSVQEQQDFFDGLKLYGKDFHSINVHMKSVTKRRARIASVSSGVSCDSLSSMTSKVKTKEQLRHFYYRKLQLCQRFVGNVNCAAYLTQPRDLREVYLLLCYDALKKIFRDKLDPRLARPDFATHLAQMVTSGSTVVRVGRKGRFRAKPPSCQALRSWNYGPNIDGRGSGSGDLTEMMDPATSTILPAGATTLHKAIPLTNIPSAISLELIPANNFSWCYVQSVAQNPRLAISVPATAKLSEIKVFLEEKWKYRNCFSEALVDNTLPCERITVIFHVPSCYVPANPVEDLQCNSTGSHEQSTASTYPLTNSNGFPWSCENLLRLSIIELFFSVKMADAKHSGNTLRLEYSIQNSYGSEKSEERLRNRSTSGAALSPALTKLLHLASIRLKLLSQQQQQQQPSTLFSIHSSRLLSPSLPRIEEEGQHSDVNFDVRRPSTLATPRRRQRKCSASNSGHSGFQVPAQAATSQPCGPIQNTVAVNFIEQLKELRVKTQKRFSRAVADVSQSNPCQLPPFEQHSPRILQPRRLMPKPVPIDKQHFGVGCLDSRAGFISNSLVNQSGNAPVVSNEGASVDASGIRTNSRALDIIITPYQITANNVQVNDVALSSSQGASNFELIECTDPVTERLGANAYVAPFGDTSLDISLPGESTLVELLKPPSLVAPATSCGNGEVRSDRPLDLGNMTIAGGRPLSPTTTTAFDLSFGDPSLGGLLGHDVSSSTSLVNKNNSLAPWMLHESSMSFFDANGPAPFDESSFLLPATSSQPQQQQSNRQNMM